MTREEALKLANSKWWEDKSPQEIAEFQLNESLLCMPFDLFHKAVEEWLGRPVWTHEFACPDELMAEGHGENKTRTMSEVLDKAKELMGDKPIIVIDSGGIK